MIHHLLLLCVAVGSRGSPSPRPVVQPRAGVEGAPGPLEATNVALVAAKVTIELLPDGRHYRVVFEHTLATGAAGSKIRVGVPMWWTGSLSGPDEIAAAIDERNRTAGASAERVPPQGVTDAATRAAREVHIVVAGREQACEPQPWHARRTDLPRPPPVPAVLVSESDVGVSGWCVAQLQLPPGTDVPLLVEYTSVMRFLDEVAGVESNDPFSFGLRMLEWSVDPIRGWGGTPDSLEVALDLGRWKPYARASGPSRPKKRGATLTWSLRGVGPAAARPIRVAFDGTPLLAADLISAWNAAVDYPARDLGARASSELVDDRGRRHPAVAAIDGDPSTAWCISSRDLAAAWIEVRVNMKGSPASLPCRFAAVGIAPGDAASDETYGTLGRPARVRLSSCDPASPGITAAVPDRPRALAPFLAWSDSRPGLVPLDPSCIRVTITSVRPANAPSVCISEVAPIFRCH